jgi:hypothetical protein
VNNDIQKWMIQGLTTANCRHGRSLSHVGNDRLDDNAGAEKVSGLSHRGALKAVETTCL